MRGLGACIAGTALIVATTGCAQIEAGGEVVCRPGPPTVLLAESVPTADRIPCIRELPAGWAIERFDADERGGSFVVSAGGDPWVTVGLRAACDDAEGRRTRSDEAGAERWVEVRAREPYRATWGYRFDGGCATYDIALPADADRREVLSEIGRALSFLPRGELAGELSERGAETGLTTGLT